MQYKRRSRPREVRILISREEALDVYQQLRTIRSFEEKLDAMMKAGRMAGFLYLYVGQEAIAVGVCAHLSDRDVVSSNHRGHGHCIAKGVDLKGMMAELFGRQSGICKGKGGSMHHSRSARLSRHPSRRPAALRSDSSATARRTKGSSTKP